MMKEYIMALDQGTTSSRCILFDHAGKIVTMAQKEFTQIYPQPGWVEQNPREIWSSQMSVAIEAMANIGASSKNIRAIGITNQRETTIVWDKKTGEPVYNAIVWQCRRTAEQIDELKEKGYGPMLQKRTGLVPDAYFSASKIAWILDHVKGAREAAEKGDVKNTYGTGCFLLMHTGKEPIISRHGLLTTIAAGTAGEVEYALEGSVFVAGAAIQWLRDGMRMIRTAGQSEEYAKRVPDSNGVYIVPAFAGMGAPYWNPYARGTIVGLTRGCKKEHFIRATLESIAYQAKDVIHAMEEDAGVTLNGLRVDGGASANNMLVQFQADIIDAAVLRPECIETTALGAAYLAGLAAGYWKDRDEIRENWQLGRRFEPVMDSGERKKLLRGWQRAVRCARLWAEDGES